MSLLDPAEFRELVSGRKKGLGAAALRCALRLAEIPYGTAVRLRNRRYDTNPARTTNVGIPVVSVGNLTLGGTGKTPMVAWAARWFRGQDVRVCVISRGYGSDEDGQNDESRELGAKLPDVPIVENPNRVEAAEMAIEEFGTQLILLDDAFQHRRIGRDLDIVLLDALEPFGFDHVFPRGTLREPVRGLARADAVVLSRAGLLDAEAKRAVRDRVAEIAPDAVWAEAAHAPQALLAADGTSHPLDTLEGKTPLAFCGIGNPQGFRHTLEEIRCRPVEFLPFPDHHRYTREDVDRLRKLADEKKANAFVCTHKDLVKLDVTELDGWPVYAVEIGIRFLEGEAGLTELLKKLVEGTTNGHE